MIRFSLDERDLQPLDALILRYPREAPQASRRAINKTLSWVRTHGRRALAHTAGIPVKALNARGRVSVVRAGRNQLGGEVWFGYLPIAAAFVGKVRQTRTGARAGRHSFPGAFVAEMPIQGRSASARFGIAGAAPTGHVGIFKRKGTLTRRTFGRPDTSSPNLPIEEQRVALPNARSALRSVFAKVPGRLRKTFLQEANFLSLKRAGRV